MIYSKIGNNGKLAVDCTECTHGCNGDQECNWDADKPRQRGCQDGDLLPEIKKQMEAMRYGA